MPYNFAADSFHTKKRLFNLVVIRPNSILSTCKNTGRMNHNTVNNKYTVSQKNIPDVFSYNSRKHCWIFIIFGRNIDKKASNQTMLYFSTSPN